MQVCRYADVQACGHTDTQFERDAWPVACMHSGAVRALKSASCRDAIESSLHSMACLYNVMRRDATCNMRHAICAMRHATGDAMDTT